MNINLITVPISFGYKHMLKTYFLEGKLPKVTKGFYGGELTKDKEAFETYCEGFKGVKLPFFNGDNYIKQLTKTIEKVLKEGK